jgi:hypothetical protein
LFRIKKNFCKYQIVEKKTKFKKQNAIFIELSDCQCVWIESIVIVVEEKEAKSDIFSVQTCSNKKLFFSLQNKQKKAQPSQLTIN